MSNQPKNLIDLTVDDEEPPLILLPPVPIHQLLVNGKGRESLGNNPFDKVLKQVDQLNDPFEILLNTETIRSRESRNNQEKIPTENLLNIDDEKKNVPPNEVDNNFLNVSYIKRLNLSGRFSSLSSIGSDVNSVCDKSFGSNNSPVPEYSSTYDSRSILNKAFQTESSIVVSSSEESSSMSTLNKAFLVTTNTNSSNEKRCYPTITNQSILAIGNSSISKTSVIRNRFYSDPNVIHSKIKSIASDKGSRSNSLDHYNKKHQLLKLSLSNSPFASPLKHNSINEDSDMDNLVFLEANALAQQLADTNFSMDDSCEDLMATKPNWVDSETEIDGDIEQIKIPFLDNWIEEDKISNNVIDNEKLNAKLEKHKEQQLEIKLESNKANSEITPKLLSLPKLEDNLKRDSLVLLMDNLKEVVNKCENDTQKAEASNLLDNLNSVLSGKNIHSKNDLPSIVRQGTFNIDSINESNSTNIQIEETKKVLDPSISQVIEKLEHVLGNQSIDVVQRNVGELFQNRAENSPYILVMNPKFTTECATPQNLNHSIPNYMKKNIRSKSLTLHEKPSSAIKAIQVKTEQRHKSISYNTPMRLMDRRKSFNESKGYMDKSNLVRRSLCLSPKKTKLTPTTKISPRKSLMKVSKQPPIKSFPLGRTSQFSNKGLKLRVGEKTTLSGPMKATVPLNNLIQIIVTSATNSNDDKNHIVTSTPLSTKTNVAAPSACSTPMFKNTLLLSTPLKKNTGAICKQKETTRSRLSYISATPNPKVSKFSYVNRRRSLSDISDKALPSSSTSSVETKSYLQKFGGTKTTSFTSKHRLQNTMANKENKAANFK